MHNKLATYGVSKFLKTLNATEPQSALQRGWRQVFWDRSQKNIKVQLYGCLHLRFSQLLSRGLQN